MTPIKIGDLFEWTTVHTGDKHVYKNVKLYSSTMQSWIPCDGLCICIEYKEGILHWVSTEGLFHTHTEIEKSGNLPLTRYGYFVFPRKIES